MCVCDPLNRNAEVVDRARQRRQSAPLRARVSHVFADPHTHAVSANVPLGFDVVVRGAGCEHFVTAAIWSGEQIGAG